MTLASLTAATGVGNTLTLQSSGAGTLGSPTADRLIVAGAAPTVINGMTSSSIVNATDNTFVTYGATNGFANVTYDTTVAGNNTTPVAIPTGLPATTKLDITTGAVVLADNLTIHALRTNRNINVGGANSKITIRSGGLIANAPANNTSLTIQPNLIFHNGTSNIEARIYTTNNGTGVANLNGSITANGITKFGTGTLNINVAQPDYASGWTVNAGTLQINDLQGLGQSVPGNTVTLNATQTTGGSASQAQGITNLTLNRDTGSPELAVFTGGPITVVNEGAIRVAAGTDDRNLQIPNVTLTSTGTSINTSGVGFTWDVPNNRFRATIPTLTLASDVTMRVYDSGSTTDTGRITAGVVNSLVGTDVNLNKIGNRTLELAGDNSATFTGGSIVVSQGTVRVFHNGSLGNATTSATIERNATLEIGVANFAPTAAVTQLAGSIERWNVENARPAVYNLPVGVNLQLNTNLLGAHVIGLNGGSLEGFLWNDSVAGANQRVVGSSVNISLLADSFVGQNVLLGQGYDLGQQPTVTGPFGDNLTGSYLVINGGISGSFNLTKTGLDTVVLASALNTYNNTIVDMGVLRIGRNNALPTGGSLVTRYAGTFDLFGFNQSVAGLGIEDFAVSPGAVSVGSSGRIVNSAPTDNILTVNNATDYTYNGTIERTVALVKEGNGTLTIGAANTFTGGTTINDGT
ncbi:MAG TPA: autotransporter-associated beta strand repeat-containing protein, partial [Chthoniobacteraceae bacterium]|nr:autotransporter-associated beta strand repeat-containing protein [Chthoniobacteraceae bacterium]